MQNVLYPILLYLENTWKYQEIEAEILSYINPLNASRDKQVSLAVTVFLEGIVIITQSHAHSAFRVVSIHANHTKVQQPVCVFICSHISCQNVLEQDI